MVDDKTDSACVGLIGSDISAKLVDGCDIGRFESVGMGKDYW